MREVRTIKNKDILLLNDIYSIMQEIVSLETRRIWQKERLRNITQHLSYGPVGGGAKNKGFEEAYAVISQLEEEHERKVRQYANLLARAERALNGIKSAKMRAFVTMIYLDHIPEREVRERLNLTRWAFGRMREAAEQAERLQKIAWNE